tara:strand:- start:228 stop:383 length:156 start_codon:yes stop_codon:yes gene_type:complete
MKMVCRKEMQHETMMMMMMMMMMRIRMMMMMRMTRTVRIVSLLRFLLTRKK